ncbi:putative thiamine transport system ATP-binding protein [Roseibium hamelinense]|uniref:Putative thiamine transport system ATP-binding protein n=1 Tax=Roseibium hamelinense TaxID=150831 RepID=A0A562SHJ7_9HYPH|nr:ATP-binding cassette domain-containing protein [Roseibium hamelinense]MTI43956.1 ATP-binding cassette domain-containing protein [Roseibium hamelinense]TWI80749.1 putative thiamine transport system ATP-binding protein [Roseibium hamelinense]
MPRTGLTLDNIRISLDQKELIAIDRHVPPGRILTVMGASGSGKTSLLNMVAGFLDPKFKATGRIILGGKDITCLPPQDRHVGLMFQRPLLFPHMSVVENLMFAVPAGIKGRRARAALAEKSLKDVSLDGMGERDPATLSGGQQTRVALMRLLLADPKALLLDEPFSSLDQELRAEIRSLVFGMARERALPVLLVTHDPDDAVAADDHLFKL